MVSINILHILAIVIAAFTVDAFAPPQASQRVLTTSSSASSLHVFGGGNKKKKADIDLSDIEVRDMTRAEMEELNRKNEEVMNMELSMMTGFSLILSLPILYLCWVAFFSE